MKIDNDKLSVQSGAADALSPMAPAGTASGAAKSAASPAQTDLVTLSADARLLKAAADAASAAPDVRADLVARMRALIDRGEMGADTLRLADAIIDDVLGSK